MGNNNKNIRNLLNPGDGGTEQPDTQNTDETLPEAETGGIDAAGGAADKTDTAEESTGKDENAAAQETSAAVHEKKKKRRKWIYFIAIPALLIAIAVIAGVWFYNLPGMGKPTVPVVARPTDMSTDVPQQTVDSSASSMDSSGFTNPADYTDLTGGAGPSDVPGGTLATDPIYSEDPTNSNVINILVVGLDARPGDKNSRTDSMMIVSWDKSKHQVTAISLMRDMLINIPGVGNNRLNAAYFYGGIGKLINTVNGTFGLDIQKYIIVDFNGAIKLVDLIGGVDVQLTSAEASYINSQTPGRLKAGMDHLTGIQALWHMRDRHSSPMSDFDRVKRQRDTLTAAFTSFKVAAKNPATLAQLVTAGYAAVTTNFSAAELTSIFTDATSGGTPAFYGYTIPKDGTWSDYSYNGMDVLKVDVTANKTYIQQLLYGN